MGEILDHGDQGLDGFGQGARFRRPVVHLGVDVDGVFAAPGRVGALVPNALEVGGLIAGAGAAEQEVAAKLVIQRGELRRRCPRRNGGCVRRSAAGAESEGTEVETDATEKGLVVFEVVGAQGRDVLFRDLGEGGLGEGGGVAGDIVEAFVAGRGGDEERDRVGVFDLDPIGGGGDFAAGRDDPDARLEAQGAGDAAGVAAPAAKDERVALGGGDACARHGGLHAGAEGNLAGLAGLETHHDDVVRITGEDLAGVVHAVEGVARAGGGGVEIELPPVRLGRAVGETQIQAADGLVRHLALGNSDQLFIDELFGLAPLVLEDETAHFGQGAERGGVDGVVGTAGPEGILVQLQTLVFQAAEDHGAEAAVAHGNGLGPLLGRLGIPEDEGIFGDGLAGENRDKNEGEADFPETVDGGKREFHGGVRRLLRGGG